MTDISIIIITWNSEDEIIQCVESIIASICHSGHLNVEIIIIDNNSSDKTISKIKDINYNNLQIYQNIKNIGFTKAVNQGITYAIGKYILLINPDTFLNEDCIEYLYKFLESHDNYAASSPKLTNEDGSAQYSIRGFPTYFTVFSELSLLSFVFKRSKIFNKWKMEYFDFSKDSDVLQPMAAALMIKKDVLDKIGNMDEQFKMFFNDVDLCKKIADMGMKIRFIKDALAIHKKGASIYKDRVKMIKTWNKDCMVYFEKYHHNSLLLLWLKISLKISSIIRIIYYKLTNK